MFKEMKITECTERDGLFLARAGGASEKSSQTSKSWLQLWVNLNFF